MHMATKVAAAHLAEDLQTYTTELLASAGEPPAGKTPT